MLRQTINRRRYFWKNFFAWRFITRVQNIHWKACYICSVFPFVHCSTSTHRHLSYQRYENVSSFPLPPLNLISSPSIKSSIRSFSKTFISSWNLISSELSTCLILLNQPTQFCSDLSGTLIHYIKQHNNFLKLSFDYFTTCNVFNITNCIDMDNFSDTFKAAVLVTFLHNPMSSK